MTTAARARAFVLLAHRYIGLLISAFLLVAGLTGSMMAFYVPLDRMLNPELFVPTPPSAGARLLDPFTLQERVNAQLPADKQVDGVILRVVADESLNYWVDGVETFIDPYTGNILGQRRFGDPFEGRKGILTFLYRLHFTLGLHEVGELLFGLAALLWTFDCFAGAYLTFPAPLRSANSKRSWLARWLPAWMLKANKLFTLVFTWHRASGLWVWLLLFVFAWSAVALNLSSVYEPVMNALLGRHEHRELPEVEDAPDTAPISLREAHEHGKRLMSELAAQRGFRVLGEQGISYLRDHGAFAYSVESTLDISLRLAETSVAFTPEGHLLSFSAPTGSHAHKTATSWLVALHFGAIRELGNAYRALVCVLGFVVATLSVTGVWIWWKKRRTRAASRSIARRRED